jgi:hypothetical protein
MAIEMPFGCGKRGIQVRKEEVEAKVRGVLSAVEKVRTGEKVFLLYNGEKIGKLKMDVPLDEVEIGRAWKSPFGIKVELEWHGRFVGSLILKGR